jgi:alkanesulfonate monooxygenase SsuD/methylene tetrahydromethanopterin reductase-like flavin-dependent oxidoreductase (luciferase family)
MRLALRFDLRAPDFGAPAAALYPAAVEMSAWADRLGFETVYLAEHHGAEDGYLPSPLVLGGAIAGRTTQLELHISALVITMHDPIRLAEDLAVLDLISNGRLSITAGMGYRPQEFALFGFDVEQRSQRYRETLEVLRSAWTGEPFDYRGQSVRIRPTPARPGGPRVYLGGSTEASARRAARLGYGFRPALPSLYEPYEEALRERGLEVPERGPRPLPTFLYVSEDPERDWTVVAPHLIHNANTYSQWAAERGAGVTKWKEVETLEELRASDLYQVLTPEECVEFARALPADGELRFHPLMGGLSPDAAWRSLELFERKVVPVLEADARSPVPIG